MKDPALNIAGRIAEIFVESKLTSLFILLCFSLGAAALLLTPKEEIPQIVIPSVQVAISMVGADAKEIERLIVKPVEGAMGSIAGVKHTFATIVNNAGFVVAEFEVGFDKSKAIVLVQERINSVRHLLPSSASPPVVTGLDVDDVPFFSITLTSPVYGEQQLRALAEKMSDHLRSLKQVSLVALYGGEKAKLIIDVSPEKLEAYGVSISQIERSLKSSNLSLPIGSFVKNNRLRSLYLDANIYDADDLNALIVSQIQGVPIYLSDVASIKRQSGNNRKQLSYFSQQLQAGGSESINESKSESVDVEFTPLMPAITIAIAKKKNTNSVDVANNILDRVERLKEHLVPKEVEVTVTRNDGQRADQAVNDLVVNLVLSMFTVVIVSVLFIGVKESLIIGFTIPLTLSLALGACYLYGVSINRITLFALILSMGMLVDAATVVIDNIYRNHDNQSSRRLSLILATNEIGGATNLATFSIILVFASLIVVSGMSGEYFFPITFTVPAVMFASLLVAYIVVPWASFRLSDGGGDIKESVFERYVIVHFKRTLRNILSVKTKRRTFLKAVVFLIFLSSLQVAWQFIRPQGPAGPLSLGAVSVAMMPKNDTNSFFIALTMPEDTPVEKTNVVAQEIGIMLETIAEVVDYQVYLGMSGPPDFNAMIRGFAQRRGQNVAEIRVNFVNKNSRDIQSFEIVKSIRPSIDRIIERYPGVTIQLVEDPAGPPVRGTILAELYHSDENRLADLTRMVKAEFTKTWGIVEVVDSEEMEIEEIRLVIDREKSLLSGIAVPQIADLLRTISSGKIVGIMHDRNEDNQVLINLTVKQEDSFDPNMLAMMTIKNPLGVRIPLSELVNVVSSKRPIPLHRKDGERVAYVGAELVESAPFFVIMDLNSRLQAYFKSHDINVVTRNLGVTPDRADTVDGGQVHWQGEVRLSLDMFRDLGGALFVALLMVFALLVAYYKSFSLPLLAMSAIPLSVIGIFPGHWLLGNPFSGPSLIGIIALAGIVMRNSLLIIDFFGTQLRAGLSIEDALVKASSMRLPAISLTATTVVIGSMFMLSDPVFGGLAVSLIFGTISATILTPFVVPILVNHYAKKHGTKIFVDAPESV